MSKSNYDCIAIFSKPLNLEGVIVYGTLTNKDIVRSDIFENYIMYLKGEHEKQNPEIDNFGVHAIVWDKPLEIREGDTDEDWIINEDFLNNLLSS